MAQKSKPFLIFNRLPERKPNMSAKPSPVWSPRLILRSLWRKWLARSPRALRRSCRWEHAHPQLETLEDRLVPTIYFNVAQDELGVQTLGHQLSDQTVQIVFWTGQNVSAISPQQISNTETAVEQILSSPYLSALPGGSNGVAHYAGAIMDSNPLPAQVSKDAIQNEEQNVLNLPQGQQNTYIYIFVTPTNWAVSNDFSGDNGKNWDHNWVGLIWYGFPQGVLAKAPDLNETGSEVDNCSLTLGHELAECMSSPDCQGYEVMTPANWVTVNVGGTSISAGETIQQICDGLQDNYFYREDDGALVEPYFTGTDGEAEVPDGSSEGNFFMRPTDPTGSENSAEQTSGYNLDVGDWVSASGLTGGHSVQNGQFDIQTASVFEPWGEQKNEIIITANGQRAEFEVGTINNISLFLDPGMTNTVTLHGLLNGPTLTVASQSANTPFNLKVLVNSGKDSVTLTGQQLTVDGANLPFANDFLPNSLEIDADAGTKFAILGTPDFSSITLNAHLSTIALGQQGRIDGLLSNLTINGGILTVDASKEPANLSPALFSNPLDISNTMLAFQSSGEPTWSVAYSALDGLTVTAAPTTPSIEVKSYPGLLTLSGGMQTNAITLDNASLQPWLTSPLSEPAITVNVSNNCFVDLFPPQSSSANPAQGVTVDDSSGAIGPIIVTGKQVDFGPTTYPNGAAEPPAVIVNYGATPMLTVNGGNTPISLESTSVPTIINALGAVSLCPTSKKLDQLANQVTVQGSSNTTLTVDDSNAAAASKKTRYYNLTAKNLTWETLNTNALPMPGSPPPTATPNLLFAGLSSLTFNVTAHTSRLDVEGTPATTTIVGATGTTINVAPFSQTLAGITGLLTLDGGNSAVNLFDKKTSSSGPVSYTFGWGTFAWQAGNSGSRLSRRINYSDIGTLSVSTSQSGPNTVAIQGTGLEGGGLQGLTALTVNAGTPSDKITADEPAIDGNSLKSYGFQFRSGNPPISLTLSDNLTINGDGGSLTIDGSGIEDSELTSGSGAGSSHNAIQFTSATNKAITYVDSFQLTQGTTVQWKPGEQPANQPGDNTFSLNQEIYQFTSTIKYTNLQNIALKGGPVDTAFNIQATTQGTAISASGKQGTAYVATVTANGSPSGSRHVVVSRQTSQNTFTFGNNSSVKSIQSQVNVTGQPGDTVLVDDSDASGAMAQDKVTVGQSSNGHMQVGMGSSDKFFATAAGVGLDCTGVGQLTVNLSNAPNDTIQATPSAVTQLFLNGSAAQFPANAAALTVTGVTPVPAPTFTAPGTGYYTFPSPLQTVNFTNMRASGRIHAMSVHRGPLQGHTSVVIMGMGFQNATGAFFGGIPASSFVVNSDTQITAVSPAEVAGLQFLYPLNVEKLSTKPFPLPVATGGMVDVTVSTRGGSSPPSSEDRFTYGSSKPAPTIVWLPPKPISYGTPLSSVLLDATASVAGSFSYDPPAGTVFDAGMQTLKATFTPTDTADYPITMVSTQLLVAAAATTVTMNPVSIVTGTLLDSSQLSGTATTVVNGQSVPVSGSFAYTTDAGRLLGPGLGQTEQVTFTPDNADFSTINAKVTVNVTQAAPQVTVNPVNLYYGSGLANAQLSGTASAVFDGQTYDISGVFTYANTNLIRAVLAAGQYPGIGVTFTPDDGSDFASVQTSVTVTVVSPNQKIPQVSLNPVNIFYGTVLDNAQLSGTATYNGQSITGSFTYTTTDGTLLGAGQGQIEQVTFTPADTADFSTVLATVTANVSPATPSIVVNPVDITAGTPLNNSQLTGTASAVVNGQTVNMPGSFAWTSAAGTVLGTGQNQNEQVTFTPTDNTDFQSVNITAVVNVSGSQQTPKVSISPVDIFYGMVLDNSQLSGTATYNGQSVAGSFTFTTAAGELLGAGQYPGIGVAFTPTDTTDFSTVLGVVTVTVSPNTPSIVANPVDIPYGTPLTSSQLAGTATAVVAGQTTNVAGSFFYEGGVGKVLNAGQNQFEAIYFIPQDGTDFNEPQAAVIVNVAPVQPQVTVNPVNITAGTPLDNSQLTGTASALVNGQTVNVPGSFAYTSAAGVVLSAGQGQSENVTFTPLDSTDFAGVTTTVTVNVAQGQNVPQITVNTVTLAYGEALDNSQLSGTASAVVNGQTVNVTGTFAYASAAGAILNAGQGQTELVTFTPDDTADFTTAQVDVTINVYQATPQVAVNPVSFVFGTAYDNAQLSGTATASFNGHIVNIPGTFTYTDSSSIGSVLGPPAQYTGIGVTFTPNDTTDYQTVESNTTVTVSKATPVIVSVNTVNINHGTPLANSQLSGTATHLYAGVTYNLAGTFTYTSAAGTVLPAGDGQSEQVTFTPSDSTDYAIARGTVTINVTTVKAAPTLTVSPVSITYGTAFANSQLSGSAVNAQGVNVPGTFGYTSVAGQVFGAGSPQVSVTFTPNDTTDYETVQKNVTVTIARATPQISVKQVTITYGTALANAQLSGTASAVVNGVTKNIAGSFSYDSGVGTQPNAGTQTMAISFMPKDATDFNGVPGTVQLVVKAAVPSISTPTSSSSANPPFPTTPITFTVRVQSSLGEAPPGTVTFMDGSVVLGTANLINVNGVQQATLVKTLSTGNHTITAVYNDTVDSDYAGVTSAALQVFVQNSVG
jgi:hypothetical protein